MLLQFVVENVLSFRDRTVFSMMPAPGVEHREGQVIQLPGGPEVLRVAALYGPNASGKSNLQRAMWEAVTRILRGREPDSGVGIPRFKLSSQTTSLPSRIEFELWLAGKRWSYGFTATQDRIESEWLYTTLGDQEVCWFSRSGQSLSFGDAAPTGSRRQFAQFVAEGTRAEQLFLAEARQRDLHELAQLLSWFKDGFDFLEPGEGFMVPWEGTANIERWLGLDPRHLRYVDELLERCDISARVMLVPVGELPQLGLGPERPRGKSSWTSQALDAFKRGLHGVNKSAERLILLRSDAVSGEPVYFGLDEESDGTNRLLEIAPLLYELGVYGDGLTLVVDELDHSLHTLLCRQIVQAALALPKGRPSQLIFTTHDTNLLDAKLLSPDGIWFVEKDPGGSSTLYSLAEFKSEQLEQLSDDLERGYLMGRFGAIPFLGDPARLGWLGGEEE